jgi:hypothetical protein
MSSRSSEIPNRMTRAIVAVVVAPGLTAALIVIADHLFFGASPWIFSIAIVAVTYLFAVVPAAVMMVVLKRLGCVGPLHFAVAGSAAALLCTAAFVLWGHSYARTSLSAFINEFLELWPLFVIGPIVGICAWIVGEAHLPASLSDR